MSRTNEPIFPRVTSPLLWIVTTGSCQEVYARFCIFPHNLAPDFPQYISGKEFKKMKSFIVYDLDSQMPVAVGEQVSAETARYCASVATGIFQANLLAEEIDLEKQITYWTTMSETSVKLFLTTKMKCAGVSALISIAFVSQAFAVLRPLIPAKPAPPFNSELIIIGDDSVVGCASKRLVYDPGQAL
jgi:hypothetical protein